LNPVIEAIKSRRTIKKMDAERMPESADIDVIIEAATWAPNHHMTEPWRFVVITGGARGRLGDALASALKRTSKEEVIPERLVVESNKPLSAPVILALIARPSDKENVVHQEEIVAAGAAMQNMLLAAQSLGLASSVRTGAHSYADEVRAFFHMEQSEKFIGLVYLGYGSGLAPPGKRTPHAGLVSWMRD
jgi:nitroreductase